VIVYQHETAASLQLNWRGLKGDPTSKLAQLCMHQKVFSNLLSFDEHKLIRHIRIGFSNCTEMYKDSQVFLGMGAHAQALGTDTTNLLG